MSELKKNSLRRKILATAYHLTMENGQFTSSRVADIVGVDKRIVAGIVCYYKNRGVVHAINRQERRSKEAYIWKAHKPDTTTQKIANMIYGEYVKLVGEMGRPPKLNELVSAAAPKCGDVPGQRIRFIAGWWCS